MLSKIILSLLLISGFSYAENIKSTSYTIKKSLDGWEKLKKDDLEKSKSLKNPNDYLNEFNYTYRQFLDGKISVERLQATYFYEDGKFPINTNDTYPIIQTWEDFLIKNPNLNIKKIKSKLNFSDTIYGKYEDNGELLKKIGSQRTPNIKYNNVDNYYMITGMVGKIDENGIIAGGAYIQNIPQEIRNFINKFFKDYYKKYPLVTFIVKGDGLYEHIIPKGDGYKDIIIPKGSYVSGKVFKDPYQ